MSQYSDGWRGPSSSRLYQRTGIHLWKTSLRTAWNFPSHIKVVLAQWNSGAKTYKRRPKRSKDSREAVLNMGIKYMTFLSCSGMIDKWSRLMEQYKGILWAINTEKMLSTF